MLHLGNNLDILKTMDDNSIDSVVTDPPYGLGKEPDATKLLADWLEHDYHEVKGKGFMGKDWDSFVPQPIFWKEVYRVLKPGGHVLSFFGTRTYDWGVMAMRLAGFEVRDLVMWVYGSGFPKSLNVGRQIDKMMGGIGNWNIVEDDMELRKRISDKVTKIKYIRKNRSLPNPVLYSPETTVAKQWEGFGTCLKPAVEPIVLARKPIAEKTVAENVLKYGTGAINIDGCRIGHNEKPKTTVRSGNLPNNNYKGNTYGVYSRDTNILASASASGRFPANIILDGSDEVVEGFPENVSTGGGKNTLPSNSNGSIYSFKDYKSLHTSGEHFADSGSASRFFYCAKAHRSERNYGLELSQWDGGEDGAMGGIQSNNIHPTVKPLDLMKYLVRLITPKGAVCLDPFMGSGTTGMACKLEGMEFIGIEQDPQYFELAKARIDAVGEVTEPKTYDETKINKPIEMRLF